MTHQKFLNFYLFLNKKQGIDNRAPSKLPTACRLLLNVENPSMNTLVAKTLYVCGKLRIS